MKNLRQRKAFTLAELLVALGVLSIISTFSINKVLTSQANVQYKAIGKETAALFSEAYFNYLNDRGFSPTMTGFDLIPYINSVKLETTAFIDDYPTYPPTQNCSQANLKCVRMQNGSILLFNDWSFGGSTNLHAITIDLDPDGAVGKMQAIGFVLYKNGMLRTLGTAQNNSIIGWIPGLTNAQPALDPDWFSWQ